MAFYARPLRHTRTRAAPLITLGHYKSSARSSSPIACAPIRKAAAAFKKSSGLDYAFRARTSTYAPIPARHCTRPLVIVWSRAKEDLARAARDSAKSCFFEIPSFSSPLSYGACVQLAERNWLRGHPANKQSRWLNLFFVSCVCCFFYRYVHCTWRTSCRQLEESGFFFSFNFPCLWNICLWHFRFFYWKRQKLNERTSV